MLIDNGWYLILENITCGYGNHSWYIEFISLVACGHSWYKFNISLVITITTRDIFQYQIPAIIYLPNITSHRIIPRSYMDVDFNSAVNGIKVGELFWLFGGINFGLGLGTHSVGWVQSFKIHHWVDLDCIL